MDLACLHIQQLAGIIGARGSCTEGELRAGDYVAEQFHNAGLNKIERQSFKGSPSAYARYAVALGLALISQVMVLMLRTDWVNISAALLNVFACLAIYAESDFRWNWTRLLIRSRPSQNVLAASTPRRNEARLAVITAHIDSHRTPFFNSSAIWQRIYNLSFRLLLLCLITCSALAIGLASYDLPSLRLFFHLLGLPAIFAFMAFVQADRTPFSPGAYDNASGVACMLALAERIRKNPLERTIVWFVATGCEETGAGGMQALLESKSDAWGDSLWINLDQTGIGDLYLRLKEGMLRRYAIQPVALTIARQASRASGVKLRERESQAFSDAIIALKKSYLTISLGASPSGPNQTTPRHQLSDLPVKIEPRTLHETLCFVSGLLELWDAGGKLHD